MRFVTILIIGFFAVPSAQALPQYFNKLRSEFPGAVFSRRCQACHHNGPQLNPFGKDFFETVIRGGGIGNEEAWFVLKAKDSDQDGVTNEEEIMQDRNPGKAD